MFLTWWHFLRGRKSRSRQRNRKHLFTRYSPVVELFEDRLVPTSTGKIWIPVTSGTWTPGQVITVPVDFTNTDGAGNSQNSAYSLDAFEIAITYDSSRLSTSVSQVTRGTLANESSSLEFDSFIANVQPNYDPVNHLGMVAVDSYRTAGPLGNVSADSLILINFTVLGGAPAGPAVIDLMANVGNTVTLAHGTDPQTMTDLGNYELLGGPPNGTGGPSNQAGDALDGAVTVAGLTSATTLTSSASQPVFGQSVTFTATVTGTTDVTPTGTVTFMEGSATLGTATLDSSGAATFTTSALAAGTDSITSVYGGDTDFSSSSATTLPQTVLQAATTTFTVSSANPSVFDQGVTFTATITPEFSDSATGTVTFEDDGTSLGTASVSSGAATFSTSTLATVQSSCNPLAYGQSITLTATVVSASPGAGQPTGTVTFEDNGTSLGTASVSGGAATFSTSTLAVGNHTITAVYGGDSNFLASTSANFSQTVNQASTVLTLASSYSSTFWGASVTFTATVGITSPGAGQPTGTVTFEDSGTPLGTGSVRDGAATFSTSSLPPGNDTITAVYGGDSNFSASTSANFYEMVVAFSCFPPPNNIVSPIPSMGSNTTTTVRLPCNPLAYGQSITLTATVVSASPGAGQATGTVTFEDNGTSLGTATLNAANPDVAVLVAPVSVIDAVGRHTITAIYGGDGNFATSTSVALTQTVSRAAFILNGTSFVYTAGANQYVLDGVTHAIDLSNYSSIQFDGNGGSAVLTGYNGQSNTATLRPNWGQLSSTSKNVYPPIVVTGVAHITVQGHSGDVASLSDTNGSTDIFNATPNRSWLQDSSRTYLNQVLGFSKVYAMAGPGSNDIGYMTDTGGPSSVFNGTPAYSYLVNNYGVLTEAMGYKRVYVTAAAGNCDIAYMTADGGHDAFNGTSSQSYLVGSVFLNGVIGFAQVHVTAGGGNMDIAYLNAASGSSSFNGTPGHSWMAGNGYLLDVFGFQSVYAKSAVSTSGVAYFTGAGSFVDNPNNGWLTSQGYLMDAVNFWRVFHV